jgi:hypothetical protein
MITAALDELTARQQQRAEQRDQEFDALVRAIAVGENFNADDLAGRLDAIGFTAEQLAKKVSARRYRQERLDQLKRYEELRREAELAKLKIQHLEATLAADQQSLRDQAIETARPWHATVSEMQNVGLGVMTIRQELFNNATDSTALAEYDRAQAECRRLDAAIVTLDRGIVPSTKEQSERKAARTRELQAELEAAVELSRVTYERVVNS